MRVPESLQGSGSRSDTPISQGRPLSLTPDRFIPLYRENDSWRDPRSGSPLINRQLKRKGSGETRSSTIDSSEVRRGLSITPSQQGLLRSYTATPPLSPVGSVQSRYESERPSIYIRSSNSRSRSRSRRSATQPLSRNVTPDDTIPLFQSQAGISINGEINGVHLTISFSVIHKYNFTTITTARRCALNFTSNTNNQTKYLESTFMDHGYRNMKLNRTPPTYKIGHPRA